MATYSHNSNDLTTLMTANDAPSPNVASASSAYWPAYGAFAHAVDDSDGKSWVSASGQTTGWLKFDFGSGNTHTALKYTLSFWDGALAARAPKSWTLQGSNNDADWDILDTQTDVAVWSAAEMRTYIFANSTAYRYYKLNVIANHGDSTFLIIGELELIGDESVEITLTNPISAQANLQSNLQIELVALPLNAQCSMSVGSIFVGTIVDCISPLTGTSSLQSDAEISIPSISLNAQGEILSNAQINIPSVNFTSTSLMSVGEILQAYLVDCPLPFSAQANLQSSIQLGVTQSLFSSTVSLYVQPEIQLFAASLISTGSISSIITDPFSVAILPRVYTFTLTGSADGVDDIVIPIRSFHSRLKSGDPTYLSIVIPGTNYASEINLRLNGDLIVRMGYLSNSGIILSEIISIVDFENIIIYDGTTNKTIILDGHRTETFTPKEINLTGSSYKNITAGKLRYRCTPNLYVRPGDTVNIDDDSFTIENITYSVSPELETFEVSE